MRKCLRVCTVVLAVAGGVAYAGEPSSGALPGTALVSGLFQLDEMDLHLHCGMERQVPMQEWIDLAVKDGRKVIVVLDHIELYRKTPDELADWTKNQGLQQWYPLGFEGQKAFLDDAASLRVRNDVITFRGWEISETELDEELDTEPMRLAEVIGWHISPNSPGDAPNGQSLIKRIRQILEVQKQFPVPMIVFHPFSMRMEKVQKVARKAGKDIKSLTVEDYRFFKPGEQEEVAALLRGQSVYIEMAHGTSGYWDDPVARAAFIADIKPLAERGVQFTVSTDGHHVNGARKPFEPEVYCAETGITPQNTNTLVRELLAIRTRNSVVQQISKTR
ncbi:MAG: hypothetical protein K1Y02_01100 [Candidatus Hydrogenedentes bacterium]|nr:hypothetical protein [Candidatus Hydrogenedentota bacterium]